MDASNQALLLYDAVGVPSPRRVRMCFAEKGLSFTSRFLNIGLMDQKRPEYLAINPTGQVPTLVHDGRVICDSNTINEYLDEVFPTPPLTPTGALERAQMRMWFWFETDFAKPFRDASYETMGKNRIKNSGLDRDGLTLQIRERTENPFYLNLALSLLENPPDENLIADRLLLIMEKMAGLEGALTDGRRWLCGDAFTLADIALAPRLDQFPLIGVNDFAARFPAAGAWLARVKARPCWTQSDIAPPLGTTELRTNFSNS